MTPAITPPQPVNALSVDPGAKLTALSTYADRRIARRRTFSTRVSARTIAKYRQIDAWCTAEVAETLTIHRLRIVSLNILALGQQSVRVKPVEAPSL